MGILSNKKVLDALELVWRTYFDSLSQPPSNPRHIDKESTLDRITEAAEPLRECYELLVDGERDSLAF